MLQPIAPSEQERKALLKYTSNHNQWITYGLDIEETTALTFPQESNNYIINRIQSIEQYENIAFISQCQNQEWIPFVKYDIKDPSLQNCFNNLMCERYSLNAIKRIANNQNLSIPRPDNLIDREYEIDRDYNFILKTISERKARKFASDLSLFTKALCNAGYNIFQINKSTINEYIITLFQQGQSGKQIPFYSLLATTIRNNLAQNKPGHLKRIEGTIYDTGVFFKYPKSPDDIIAICEASNNPVFDNLMISFYIRSALYEHRSKINCLYNIAQNYFLQALELYLERSDHRDYFTCLNRDLTSIIQCRYNQSTDHLIKMCDSVDQGTPMSFIKATGDNIGKINEINLNSILGGIINPYFQLPANNTYHNFAWIKNKLFALNMNCTSCVAAYELRRKGWDVIARPNMTTLSKDKPYPNQDNYIEELSYHSNIVWINHATESAPDIIPLTNKEQIKNVCFEGERYHLSLYTAEREHITTFEKINGNVYIYDPQLNTCDTIEDYFKDEDISELYYYRVDNCYPIISYASKVVFPNNADKSSLGSFNIKPASGVDTHEYKAPSIDPKLNDDISDYINQVHQEAAKDPEYIKHLNDELKQTEETLKKFDKNDADYDDWLKHMKSPCK